MIFLMHKILKIQKMKKERLNFQQFKMRKKGKDQKEYLNYKEEGILINQKKFQMYIVKKQIRLKSIIILQMNMKILKIKNKIKILKMILLINNEYYYTHFSKNTKILINFNLINFLNSKLNKNNFGVFLYF